MKAHQLFNPIWRLQARHLFEGFSKGTYNLWKIAVDPSRYAGLRPGAPHDGGVGEWIRSYLGMARDWHML